MFIFIIFLVLIIVFQIILYDYIIKRKEALDSYREDMISVLSNIEECIELITEKVVEEENKWFGFY